MPPSFQVAILISRTCYQLEGCYWLFGKT